MTASNGGKAKWTFMVYMAGFNNLSPFSEMDLAEMQWVGSTSSELFK